MPIEEAKKTGARALFGEKYGAGVRRIEALTADIVFNYYIEMEHTLTNDHEMCIIGR